MRILFVNQTCGTGSIGRLTKELAESLEQKGHECVFAYSHGKSNYHNCYKIGNVQDHNIHAIMSRVTGLQGYFSKRATYKLIRFIDNYKPDIVQLCNLHGNYICQPLLYQYLAQENIATVLVLHDCWFFTGKCTYPTASKCTKWKSGCGKCPQLHTDNVNRTFFFDTSRRCIDDKERWYKELKRIRTIGVSMWITGEAKQSVLGHTDPVTIYNWVDSDVFRPRKNNIKKKLNIEGKFMILMVAGNISYKKGYSEMVGIADAAKDDTAIVVVGKNKNKLPLPNNVIHIEHTDNAVELAEFYSAADVCVNTTRYETFGMVTAESLSCGTPVIIYNNTASPELVDKKCGIVVDEHEGINGIKAAVDLIRNNGKNAYSEYCYRFAREHFDRERLVKEYERLYLSMTGDLK